MAYAFRVLVLLRCDNSCSLPGEFLKASVNEHLPRSFSSVCTCSKYRSICFVPLADWRKQFELSDVSTVLYQPTLLKTLWTYTNILLYQLVSSPLLCWYKQRTDSIRKFVYSPRQNTVVRLRHSFSSFANLWRRLCGRNWCFRGPCCVHKH